MQNYFFAEHDRHWLTIFVNKIYYLFLKQKKYRYIDRWPWLAKQLRENKTFEIFHKRQRKLIFNHFITIVFRKRQVVGNLPFFVLHNILWRKTIQWSLHNILWKKTIQCTSDRSIQKIKNIKNCSMNFEKIFFNSFHKSNIVQNTSSNRRKNKLYCFQ